ncbi:serine/threonine protein kinase [Methanoplanus sp. FWC-SCC4]|uniref:Serine/threonine protein kinase n=1 Tax=Methanochimaera problematica TaxID=2609417 RepID=A0AA97FDH5_9EURY|nr:serine/threonine-protein kinase [Methanoplanus sp. FWC-SCC4]WOF15456.1 serine/threonine protein kinase [Methanoplanus sp. FWC-SCC4]
MITDAHKKTILIIISAIFLILATTAPAMAGFGNQGQSDNGQRNIPAHGTDNAPGNSGQGQGTQTALPVIYGLFIALIVLVAIILYIIFVRLRPRKKYGEENKKQKSLYEYGKTTVLEENKNMPPNFPPELKNRYSDVELIGKGGLSFVFQAKIKDTEEIVAVKIPALKDEKSGRIFLQEIKIWEGLSHPNIVSIKSVNVFPVPYVEMEYVPDSLNDLHVPVKPDIALHIAAGILRGLSYAHSKGIIHCDIKPGNILIDSDFIPKIADWGVGRDLGRKSSGISGYTPAFAAPEQMSSVTGEVCTVRTDIYQTGMLIYWMLFGNTSFEEEMSGIETSGDIKYPLINRIVMKCIQKNPEKRYATAEELLEEILSISGSTVTG